MKLKALFIFIFLVFLQSPNLNLRASEAKTPNNLFLSLPAEHLSNIASNLNISSLRNWKLVCKQFNNNTDYEHINSNIIKAEDYMLCSNALIYFAHKQQDKNFIHFLQNKPKKRQNALTLLGWHTNLTNAEKMSAYQGVLANQIPKSLSYALDNPLALKIVCLSINPNIQDSEKWTLLHWASCKGSTEIIKILLVNEKIKLNIEDNYGNTPLDLAHIHKQTTIIQLLYNKNADRGSAYHRLWWNNVYKPLLITIILLALSIYTATQN